MTQMFSTVTRSPAAAPLCKGTLLEFRLPDFPLNGAPEISAKNILMVFKQRGAGPT